MDMARFAYITIVISASLGLGFIFGKAYVKRKMKKLTRRVQVLENFKHAVKVLCPKIKDGEDSIADYLPKKIKGIVVHVNEFGNFKSKISKGLIKIGFRPEEFEDLDRIFDAAIGFAEERGIGDLEDKAETWKKNFETILKTHKEIKSKEDEDTKPGELKIATQGSPDDA